MGIIKIDSHVNLYRDTYSHFFYTYIDKDSNTILFNMSEDICRKINAIARNTQLFIQ